MGEVFISNFFQVPYVICRINRDCYKDLPRLFHGWVTMGPSVLASRWFSVTVASKVGMNTIGFAFGGDIICPLYFSAFELCWVLFRQSLSLCTCIVAFLLLLTMDWSVGLAAIPCLARAMRLSPILYFAELWIFTENSKCTRHLT